VHARDEVLEIGVDICDALIAAHAKGIIHRDLKPANIWVTTDGHTKVLDYGIAKLEAEPKSDPDAATTLQSGQLTSIGLVMGTAGYMAPEQARGQKVDARGDIFSLGAVLYELATGTAPFAGETTAIVFGRLLNEQPTPVRTLNSALPEEFEAIVLKALEKDSAFRYQAARDLRVDLKRLQRGTAVGTGPPHGITRAASASEVGVPAAAAGARAWRGALEDASDEAAAHRAATVDQLHRARDGAGAFAGR